VHLSNEDVSRGKPDPEIYTEAMRRLGLSSDECLIVEDNENGIRAARASGAHVLVVKDVNDTNFTNIMNRIEEIGMQSEAA
jgi:beta-phosphoglucomutase-like phosphatase (HAD superfamily)